VKITALEVLQINRVKNIELRSWLVELALEVLQINKVKNHSSDTYHRALALEILRNNRVKNHLCNQWTAMPVLEVLQINKVKNKDTDKSWNHKNDTQPTGQRVVSFRISMQLTGIGHRFTVIVALGRASVIFLS